MWNVSYIEAELKEVVGEVTNDMIKEKQTFIDVELWKMLTEEKCIELQEFRWNRPLIAEMSEKEYNSDDSCREADNFMFKIIAQHPNIEADYSTSI